MVIDLKHVVDRIHKDFKEARDLILEIAHRLDEGRFCERGHISRRIKEMLQDQIKERKITPKWIEDCLPREYKRKYTSKSEVSSLSDNDNDAATAPEETKKIVVDTQGRPIEEENLEPTADRVITNAGDILTAPQEGLNKQIKPDLECPSCKELYAEVIELSETVKKITFLKTADDMLVSSISLINENQLDPVGFEFPLQFGDVSKYIDAEYSRMGDDAKIWFSGKIDKKSGHVISAKTGRIDQQDRF